jgi:hypothetical protein
LHIEKKQTKYVDIKTNETMQNGMKRKECGENGQLKFRIRKKVERNRKGQVMRTRKKRRQRYKHF